jgi:hypothetical protein
MSCTVVDISAAGVANAVAVSSGTICAMGTIVVTIVAFSCGCVATTEEDDGRGDDDDGGDDGGGGGGGEDFGAMGVDGVSRGGPSVVGGDGGETSVGVCLALMIAHQCLGSS